MYKQSFLLGFLIVMFVGGCRQKSQLSSRPISDVPVINAQLEYKASAMLGEGAFWDYQNQQLFWVDIEGRRLHIYNPKKSDNQTFTMPSRIGTVVPQTDSTAVVALEDGIYNYNYGSQALTLLSNVEAEMPENRFNDGKCDPTGNLWVGSMRRDESKPTAALYKVEPDGTTTKMVQEVTISNGIVWSGDQRTMYYIDTPSLTIRAFDYDPELASISNERVAVSIPPSLGFPDGMAIDEHDNLWVGLWNGNAVGCFDPDSGKLVKKISVPAHNVTSCAFGGPQLDKLYITTAGVDMSEEEMELYPLAGSLFVADPGVKGVKSPFFGTH